MFIKMSNRRKQKHNLKTDDEIVTELFNMLSSDESDENNTLSQEKTIKETIADSNSESPPLLSSANNQCINGNIVEEEDVIAVSNSVSPPLLSSANNQYINANIVEEEETIAVSNSVSPSLLSSANNQYINANIVEEEETMADFNSDDSVRDPDFVSNEEHSSQSDENEPNASVQLLGKKRLRKPDTWKRTKIQKLRNSGKEYTDRKDKVHLAKQLREFTHNCRYRCNENIDEAKRSAIFKDYWNLGSWDLQSSFLNGSITLEPIKRKKQGALANKQVSCIYKLLGVRVCKEFFLKTLDISNKRLQNVVNKKKNSTESDILPTDLRGKKNPANKITQDKINLIHGHINSFPRYSSHYSREKHTNLKYLHGNLNLKTMYELYVSFCNEKGEQPVKESYYRHIFNTQFNLSFHRPATDTCTTCDKLSVVINHGSEAEKIIAAEQKQLHLKKSEIVKDAKKACSSLDNTSTVAIVFDLQKTMPTPNLSNSKAYYYRQLWTYNLNIHNLSTGEGRMYMWHEGQASRGCQEISSCLYKFIKTLPPQIKFIQAFSDNCGGQNKSHFTVKFWLYIIRNTQIEAIDHKFLISGHSYNECDQDFGLIEIKKKRFQRDLLVPEHWAELVASSSKKFVVIQMQDEDFIDLDTLEPYFKKNVPGIREMQWLHFEKKDPFTLYYKKDFSDNFNTMGMKSNKAGRVPQLLPELGQQTERPKIKYLKYANLMELLQFVPPIYHDFFKNLPHEEAPSRVRKTPQEDLSGDEVYSTDEE